MRDRIVVVAALALTGCISVSPSVSPAMATAPSDQARAVQDYLRELQEAYDAMVARSEELNPPLADPDAALSIAIPTHPSIGRSLTYFQTALHDSIQASLYRSRDYKEMINAVLDGYGLPRALAYLPVIESAYLPGLTSRAGAHGIWQFMPSTGRLYGLHSDWWIDERADPVKSTHAAIQYLGDLHREFGDWALALAAYNCGPGRVHRALNQHKVRTFWELLDRGALPKETRGYVPTFFATLLIVSDPAMYGFRLTDTVPAGTTTVEVDGPVSLEYIAGVTGESEETLRAMNPELRRGLVPPRRYTLRVPAGAAEPIARRAESLRHQDPVLPVATFTLRQSITALSKQIGVPVSEILEMNGRASARPGDTLYLPLRQQELSARLQPDRHHVVSQGETLYSIAKAAGLTIQELRELNQLDQDYVLRAGDRLRIGITSAVLAGN